MKTFKQYFKENIDSIKGQTFSADIPNVGTLSGSVLDLINLSQKYKTHSILKNEYIKLKKISTDFEDKSDMEVKYKGEWVKYDNLPEEEKLKIDSEEQQRINKADLKYPVIVAGTREKPLWILDGNHRVDKAAQNNVNKLDVKYIPLDALNEFK